MLLLAILARIVFTVVAMGASAYCVLSYVPFTYHQVIRGGLLPWLDALARHYCWVFAGAGILMAFPLSRGIRTGGWPRFTAAMAAAYIAVTGVMLFVTTGAAGLQNDASSLLWAVATLVPVLLVALADVANFCREVAWTENSTLPSGALFWPAIAGALFVTLSDAAIVFLQRDAAAVAAAPALIRISLARHLILFLAAYLVLEWIAAVASLWRRSAMWAFWFVHLFAAGVIGWFLHAFIARPLGLPGASAWMIPALFAITFTFVHAALALCVRARVSGENGVYAAFSLAASIIREPVSGWAAVAIAGAGAVALSVGASGMDWNHLAGATIAAAFWTTAFACFVILTKHVPANAYIRTATVIGVLIFYRWTDGAASAAEVDAWTGYDNSLRIVREVLSAPRTDESPFYGYLAANTNIPASVRVAPVDISLADLDRSPSSVRPHVFVIVVDSLRRDYLSPYNESVPFTPAIQEFARDSVVFENAFTRYGGTGLSEPSIWTGAMLLHKQYITPFRPMNTLQKLLRAEGYQLYVSRDSILRIVLEPDVTDVDLDPPESTMNYDLARTFAILEERIRQRAPSAAPIFVYTQPQNLHVSVIRREGGGCGDCGSSYKGFYAPYAYRVRAVDQAFGHFVSFLRTRGLYENSIIILTADHGDSLGEEGRWGHAYTLFPEIVRVPLIMHVPARMREDFSTDPRRPAFLTDIAPTLYSLLGFKTPPDDGIHGAPLFAPGSAAPPPRSAPYLLASSYGAVYGLLSNNATELFVADAVNRRRYMFNLRARQPVSQPLSVSDRNAREKVIREAVAGIARFYRFTEPGERK